MGSTWLLLLSMLVLPRDCILVLGLRALQAPGWPYTPGQRLFIRFLPDLGVGWKPILGITPSLLLALYTLLEAVVDNYLDLNQVSCAPWLLSLCLWTPPSWRLRLASASSFWSEFPLCLPGDLLQLLWLLCFPDLEMPHIPIMHLPHVNKPEVPTTLHLNSLIVGVYKYDFGHGFIY